MTTDSHRGHRGDDLPSVERLIGLSDCADHRVMPTRAAAGLAAAVNARKLSA